VRQTLDFRGAAPGRGPGGPAPGSLSPRGQAIRVPDLSAGDPGRGAAGGPRQPEAAPALFPAAGGPGPGTADPAPPAPGGPGPGRGREWPSAGPGGGQDAPGP